jgi:hypothetical protein
MASNYRSHKSVIGKMRRKYGLKDNVDLKKAEIAMTPDDWKIFSEALTFPNGKPSEREDK